MSSSKRIKRTLAAFSVVVAALAPALPALANHGTTPIKVGVRQSDGSTGRNEYDPSDVTVMVGASVDFAFDNGFHNVAWAQQPSGASLAPSPGSPGGDTVGSTFSVTPNVAGTYIYYCSIHSNSAEALAATDFGSGSTGGMYGRIQANADSTAPVWNTGSATATAVSASQIDLTWPSATDNSGSVFFDVYQATGTTDPGKGAATLIGNNTTGTAYSASGLTAGAHYWYWITPVDGAGNAGPDLTADATTTSVAASASAETVLSFSVNPTLTIQVDTAALSFGVLNPAVPSAVQTATVTVDSNDTWSLSIKSTGRDGVDDAAGDDGVFTDDSGLKTIPVGRATWNAGAGATPLSEVGDMVLTGQPAGQGIVGFGFQIDLQSTDSVGTGYSTTVLYTATQP